MMTRETVPVSAANPFPSGNTSHSVMCAGQLFVCLLLLFFFWGGGGRSKTMSPSFTV